MENILHQQASSGSFFLPPAAELLEEMPQDGKERVRTESFMDREILAGSQDSMSISKLPIKFVYVKEAVEIPEDPLVAEQYYADVFDSCSEDSEEEMIFSEARGDTREEEPSSVYRTNPQDSDTDALVGCLEHVLGYTSLDTKTVTNAVADMSPGPTVFNNAVARTKMKRMKESAVQKLGMEAFEEVYDYLKRARHQNAGEAEIWEHLETVVPRASDCFEVDQLLYFEELLLTMEGKESTLQNLH